VRDLRNGEDHHRPTLSDGPRRTKIQTCITPPPGGCTKFDHRKEAMTVVTRRSRPTTRSPTSPPEADIEADRPRARRDPPGGPRLRGEPGRGYIRRSSRPSATSSSAAARCCSSRSSRRPGCSAPSGCRWPRSSRTWRSATTSCTVSGTGCATPRSTPRPGSGTTSPRPSSGSTPTTSCTTPTPTSSARTTTSATASCGSTRPALAPSYLLQPIWNFLNACFFEEGIAMPTTSSSPQHAPRSQPRRGPGVHASPRQGTCCQDRAQSPRTTCSTRCCPGPSSSPPWPPTSPRTSCATCGPTRSSCAVTSPRAWRPSSTDSIEGETRGEWYLRQMLGSANISGGKLIHLMSGNLSHQIEHHLFPDLPSNRYAEIAPDPCRGLIGNSLRPTHEQGRPPGGRGRDSSPGTCEHFGDDADVRVTCDTPIRRWPPATTSREAAGCARWSSGSGTPGRRGRRDW
jgi:hypothetical protein